MKVQQNQTETITAMYARVSSHAQKKGETIESQIAALHELAHDHGLTIPDEFVFSDNGLTGIFLEREGLDELRDIIRTEPVETLFIYSPGRLARIFAHQLILLDEFQKFGVKVVFLKSSGETDTPEGVMSVHLQGIFAEYERTMIMDRSRRGRMYKARQNDPAILPCMPYGYLRTKTNQGTLVQVIEEEAMTVKEIFRLYTLEAYPLQRVAEEITRKRILTPTGKSKWSVSTVRGILKNQAYIGTTHYGRTERCEGSCNKIRHYKSGKFKKAKYARRDKPQSDWIPIDMPQIISENDFELAQERICSNAAHAARNTKDPGLLQGLVLCGECGRPFYKRSRKYPNGNKNSYTCSSRNRKETKSCSNISIKQEDIDDLVYKEVISLVKNPSLIQEELMRRVREAPDTNAVIRKEATIRKELSKLTQEIDRLLDAYQGGLLSLEDLRKRNISIDLRKKDFEKKMQAIQALKLDHIENNHLESNLNVILQRMQSKADGLSFQDKQTLIRLLVEKVVIKMDEITIIHCVSPRAIANESGRLSFDGHGYHLSWLRH